MRHAGPTTLAALAPLLDRLRRHPALAERSTGSFYVRSKAFLHFHEDPAGTFADVKLDLVEFTRVRVTTKAEQSRLLAMVARALPHRGPRPARSATT